MLPLWLLLASPAPAAPPAPSATAADAKSVFPQTLTRLDGTPMPAAELAGKVVLVVNVASRCGYTKQYDALQKLYATYAERGLVVVGVPCNQFGGQEPGSAEEIATFCRMNYGVEFPLLEKQDVNGASRSELYRNLIASGVGGDGDIRWNFEKFLVGRDGAVRARWASRTAPDDPELVAAVEAALGG